MLFASVEYGPLLSATRLRLEVEESRISLASIRRTWRIQIVKVFYFIRCNLCQEAWVVKERNVILLASRVC